MRVKKNVLLLASLSLIFCLSGCKDSKSNKPDTQKTPVAAPVIPIPDTTEATPEDAPIDPPVAEDIEDAAVDESDNEETKIEITDESFGCIRSMRKVRNMYIGNLLGNIEETLAVANSPDGGVYPPGSIVQVLPGEAMVKLRKGAHPATGDWEFFVLDVSKEGGKIKQRGFEKVGNPLGTCFSCHSQTAPKWDMICEKNHGCPPITFPGINTEILIPALQKTDRRCDRPPEPLSAKEIETLKKLQVIMKAAKETATNGGQE